MLGGVTSVKLFGLCSQLFSILVRFGKATPSGKASNREIVQEPFDLTVSRSRIALELSDNSIERHLTSGGVRRPHRIVREVPSRTSASLVDPENGFVSNKHEPIIGSASRPYTFPKRGLGPPQGAPDGAAVPAGPSSKHRALGRHRLISENAIQ